MPGRKFSAGNSYRYGFNGKENDNDDGIVQYDYGFRIYDPRLVKFKSLDPLQKKFPELTPYQFASNSPIANVDLDGKEAKYYATTITQYNYFGIDNNGKSFAYTKVFTKTEESKPWFFNGALGTGTLYTVKRQTIEVRNAATDFPQYVSGEVTTNHLYKFSPSDEKLMNKKINRSQYKGSFQVMLFGNGNGLYPDDDLGSKPNPNAKTLVVDMKTFNEVVEPLMLASDIKNPLLGEIPKIDDIFNEAAQQKIDKITEDREKVEAKNENRIVNCTECNENYKDSSNQYVPTKGEATDTIEKGVGHTNPVNKTPLKKKE